MSFVDDAVKQRVKDFSIIATSNNSSELRTLEFLYIYNRKPDLNIDQSATPLFIF